MSDRVQQIKQKAIRVTPTDVGKWQINEGTQTVADGYIIAPADLAYLIALAEEK